MFNDTFFSSVESRLGNTCAHIYCNDLRWTQIHPMKSKLEAHHNLSILLAQDGVLNVMVMDNAMKKMAWEFKKKSRDTDFHICSTEPLPPTNELI